MVRRLASAAIASTVLVLGSPPCAAENCKPETATALYGRARKAFEEKKFDESIALLREANACDPNPIYFANIARAYEEAGRPRDALTAWKSYREVVVDPRERSRAQGRIDALTKTIADLDARDKKEADAAAKPGRPAETTPATPAPAPAPAPAPEKPPEESSRSVSPLAFVVTGVGLVALGTGVVLGLSARSKHDSAVDERDAARAQELQSDAESGATTANIVMVAGGAIAAGGLVWIGIDLFKKRDRDPVSVGFNGRGLALSGSF